MWGLPSVSDNLAESLPLLSGRWPEGTEEISIHREFADRSGLGVGEETSLAAMQAPGKITSGVTAEVVGVFGGTHDIYPEVLSSAGFAQQLAGGVSNLALLWAREVEPIEVESPMSPEVRTYRMPQLADLFEGFRWGTRAPAVEEFADTRDLHPSAARAGRTIPYGMLVQGRARIDGGEEPGLRGMYGGLGARLAQATLMIFFSQAVALTVILAIVVVDRQRTFGAYKVMGLASGGVWRLYFAQVLLTAAAAGVTGLLLFRLLAGVFGTMLGFTLHLPVLSVVLWGAAALALSVWSAHLASSLFDTTDIDSLLRETYDFDWWSLVRLTGLSVQR